MLNVWGHNSSFHTNNLEISWSGLATLVCWVERVDYIILGTVLSAYGDIRVHYWQLHNSVRDNNLCKLHV